MDRIEALMIAMECTLQSARNEAILDIIDLNSDAVIEAHQSLLKLYGELGGEVRTYRVDSEND